MHLTDEQIAIIERCGKVFLTRRETAEAIGVNPESFLELFEIDLDHPAVITYQRAQALSKIQLREKIWNMADNGSAPAQALAKDIMKQTAVHEAGSR